MATPSNVCLVAGLFQRLAGRAAATVPFRGLLAGLFIAAVVATVTTSVAKPMTSRDPVVTIDLFRAMTAELADFYPTEDDDVADLGGVVKYTHTELITEHLLDPMRRTRKYNIDCIKIQRYKIRNPPDLLKVTTFTDFGDFLAYDFGVATNPAQTSILEKFGDFVGIQAACPNGFCDVRFPTRTPYFWFSVGNWCPNLSWGNKGTKQHPSPKCLKKNDGGSLMGGLCHGGIDSEHVTPVMEPTGGNGCIYTFGKSQVVKLDNITGITHEDCGGRTCRDWLDFRLHCTVKEYKRKFDMQGNIVKVDYCVEYDIHPACEANCHTPHCRKHRETGEVTELGIPFWAGRCDPGANDRRVEAFAPAFGIQGALTSHQLVNKDVLDLGISCLREGSVMCIPSFKDSGGPYCSRSFSGVCGTCYIPGTANGIKNTPKPFCPLDVLDSIDYKDRASFPLPACASKKPSDLCCLYTRTCNGTPKPDKARLNDDGLALVSARKNTEDMMLFLMRAAREYLNLEIVDEVVLKYSAYYQWGTTPRKRTLAGTLAELKAFVTAPKNIINGMPTFASMSAPPAEVLIPDPAPVPKIASTTTISTTTTHVRPIEAQSTTRVKHTQSTTPAGQTQETTPATHKSTMSSTVTTVSTATSTTTETVIPADSGDCYEKDVSFELTPGLGGGKNPTIELDLRACQKHCDRTIGCLHFSYMKSTGKCHLHDAYAKRNEKASAGSVAGPFKCWQDIGPENFTCMEWGTYYSGDSLGKAKNFSSGSFHRGPHAVIACQKLCAAVDGCTHFVIELPSKECRLMGKRATKQLLVMQAIAGPPVCAFAVEDTNDVIVFSSGGNARRSSGFFATLGGVMLAVCLACIGCVALHRTGKVPWPLLSIHVWSDVPRSLGSGESDAMLLSL